ncbi:Bcl2-associated athanogene 1 [Fasciola gigantica]|uniref:BAG family molecular chaperone regulator 1 n=1 Tax=Fasciola gigantica TaxID=46835 RepID=A0A504YJG5_FASGI|nr:Bcl2-associated athanogene 1 [Fasciola gigantica]
MTSVPLTVTAVFNGQSSKITVDSGPDSPVSSLMSAVQKQLRIPTDKQRIIFKGRSLLDPEASLSSCGVKNGAKIMILGSVEQLDPNEVDKLKSARHASDSISSELEKLRTECADPSSLPKAEVSCRLKVTLGILEKCMKCLESLDSVRLPYDSESERKERKNLVDFFQDLMTKADELKVKLVKASECNSSQTMTEIK